MSARFAETYYAVLFANIRPFVACGHNKLCPYSWRYADIHKSKSNVNANVLTVRYSTLQIYLFTVLLFYLFTLLHFYLYTNISPGSSTNIVAPFAVRKSLSLKPHSTLMHGRPLLRAVATSTSLSPT